MATDETTRGTIQIRDVGPIERLSIPVPEGGGLVVLRGRNGAGKSVALRSIESLANGSKQKLPLRDGAERGEVAFDGVRITVGRRQVQAGELDVATLEGRFDLGALVDPGIADPAKADARRIKALLAIGGRGVEPEVFYEHVLPREELRATVGHLADIDARDDPNELAECLRRALQEAARSAEAAAEAAEKQCEACRDAVRGVDLNMPEPQADAVEQATAALARLQERQRQAAKQRERAEVARQMLAEATPPGTPLAEAQSRADQTALAHDLRGRERHKLERLLEEARQREDEAAAAAKMARDELERAVAHERFVAQCRDAMEAHVDDGPDSEEISAAERAVREAKAAIADYAIVERAAQKAAQAKVWQTQLATHRERATTLRTAAANVDAALSALVGRLGTPLFVRDGRLMTTSSRGDVPFAELSDGERYRLALDVGIRALGETDGHAHKLLVLSQAAYEALDPHNRQAIAEQLKGTGVVLITAEADAGELTAEAG